MSRPLSPVTRSCRVLAVAFTVSIAIVTAAQAGAEALSQQTYRLYDGISLYMQNSGGDFQIDLDLRDLNTMSQGPRETLVKLYDPDGHLVVREFIPDDGVAARDFQGAMGGWDHELMYTANLYAKGTKPATRFSAWSDPARLATLQPRRVHFDVTDAKPGTYRLLVVGVSDHYATVTIPARLKTGVSGHSTFLHASGNRLARSYIYVPQGATGLFLALIEPDAPQTRRYRLLAPDDTVIWEGTAGGGYINPSAKDFGATLKPLAAGEWAGKLLTFEASDGPSDFLVKLALTFPRPKGSPFADYVGMGSQAVFAPDRETALALRGGTTVVDGEIYWHGFQIRFHKWLQANPLPADASEARVEERATIQAIHDGFRLLETSDGRGSSSWTNWAYAQGYYGMKVYRPIWLLLQRDDIPADLRAIITEGLIMSGDRLSFATGIERVNGNAFAQINVALWYCHLASRDALQKERFELFWSRWVSGEGWGRGAGLSRSGDSQEHFAHDAHYGSYLMDNWIGRQWVVGNLLEDAKSVGDKRFQTVVERYRELYTYLYCRDADGTPVAANPWSSRTHMWAHLQEENWEPFDHKWKGEPGPDFTVSVNGGDEWFAARRKSYYALTFHGRLTPEWMSRSFSGQLGFGGGTLCQVTVPGKGAVITGTLHESYGAGMHPSEWRRFHIHSLVGERWDGTPVISAISDHEDTATLDGTTATSTGEIRDTYLRVTRSFDFQADRIRCSVALAESDYTKALTIWGHDQVYSDMRLAYEMIPYRIQEIRPRGKHADEFTYEPLCTVTLRHADGSEIGPATDKPQTAAIARIDRGGYGVDIVLPQPMPIQLGEFGTVLIQIIDKRSPVTDVALTYDLVPYGN